MQRAADHGVTCSESWGSKRIFMPLLGRRKSANLNIFLSTRVSNAISREVYIFLNVLAALHRIRARTSVMSNVTSLHCSSYNYGFAQLLNADYKALPPCAPTSSHKPGTSISSMLLAGPMRCRRHYQQFKSWSSFLSSLS